MCVIKPSPTYSHLVCEPRLYEILVKTQANGVPKLQYTYVDVGAGSGHRRQGYLITPHSKMGDFITNLCLRQLLRAPNQTKIGTR